MTLVLAILTVQVILGAFDNLWHHEITQKLPARPGARAELALHALRELLYAALFGGIAWAAWHGAWALVVIAILGAEVAVTLWDFVVEDRTRRLPRLERVLHSVLAINVGVLIAVWAPELAAWMAAPTAVVAVDYGIWSWLFAAFALGVLAWAIRDLAAVIALGVPEWQRHPIERGTAEIPKQVLVTGATGFVGTALTRALIRRGDRVVVLTRDPAKAAHLFGPHADIVGSLAELDRSMPIDAIVNLAGEPLAGGLWTQRRKRLFVASRLQVTHAVLDLIRRLDRRPEVLVSGSAVGYYGDRSDERLTETSAAAPIFMSELCQRWEAAAQRATRLGVRTVCLRIGLVLGRDGGALAPLALATRLGLGAILGAGWQWVSWIHRDDLVRLILFTIDTPRLHGAVNANAPQPTSNAEFMQALAAQLGRAIRLRAGARPLRLLLGELASLFLASQRALPTAAVFAGFEFAHPNLDGALAELFPRDDAAVGADTYVTVLLNEACPVCRGEMGHYERIATRWARPVRFRRIADAPQALRPFGLSEADIRRRLFVIDRAGGVSSGIDAAIAVWRELPRYRWLAAVMALPVLHRIGDMIYEGIVVPVIGRWNAHRRANHAAHRQHDGQHA